MSAEKGNVAHVGISKTRSDLDTQRVWSLGPALVPGTELPSAAGAWGNRTSISM